MLKMFFNIFKGGFEAEGEKFTFSDLGQQGSPDSIKEGDLISLPILRGAKFRVVKTKKGGMRLVAKLSAHHIDQPAFLRMAQGHGDTQLALKTYQLFSSNTQFDQEVDNWIQASSVRGVVKPLGYTVIETFGVVIMPWIEVGLRDVPAGSMAFPKMLDVVSELATTLNEVYRKHSLLHRDIKPANILIENGHPVLIDFGVSQTREPTISEKHLLNSSNIVGTSIYMAPELLTRASGTSIQTEIFSFGISIIEWILGKHPYEITGFNPDAIRHLVQTMKVALTDTLPASISEKLISTLLACISFESSERPKDFAEILQRLGYNSEQEKINENNTVNNNPLTIFLSAQKSREKKDFQDAILKLDTGLNQYPNDLLLMNGKGNVYLAMGRTDKAKAVFVSAFDQMKMVGGKREDKPYIDPAMTLFGLLLAEEKFDKAYEVLESCYMWLGEEKEKYIGLYDSFALLYIYKGSMEEAANLLSSFLSRKSLNAASAEWMVFALVANDLSKEDIAFTTTRIHAPNILKVFLNDEFIFSMTTPFVIKLLSAYSPDPDRAKGLEAVQQIGKTLPQKFQQPLNDFADGGHVKPKDIATVLTLLDAHWTGGSWRKRTSRI
jgi:serine/threonine protein kinase